MVKSLRLPFYKTYHVIQHHKNSHNSPSPYDFLDSLHLEFIVSYDEDSKLKKIFI